METTTPPYNRPDDPCRDIRREGFHDIIVYRRCAVCGGPHAHELTLPLAADRDEIQDAIRANETCDTCWAWSIRFDS